MEPMHAAVLPDDQKHPRDWNLAEWQGLLEELAYQHENQHDDTFKLAHDALRWLVDYFLARRMNDPC